MEDDLSLIPLKNIDTKILIKIIEYMKKNTEKTQLKEEEIKNFGKEFLKRSFNDLLSRNQDFGNECVKGSFNDLFELVLTSNYLHISGSMDLLCQSKTDRTKNKWVEAVWELFNITNDESSKEEEKVRDVHKWAHEGGEIDESLY
ncbi:hypothetical protein RND71_016417 [Anisodus tanguticus]|uniref:SKP1 component POZ domain-containing protein n=1 Tax=Anisodus tanguticus TaxID=243964 RepID=A0AAE1S8G3_9SOLA|nr:hypothetical protein RND71_016417 [Anisodus tanguticus]